MRNIIILFVFLMISAFARSQVLESFYGKWRVVEINNGVIYNYKTDQVTVTDSLATSLRGRKDSTNVIRDFSSWAAGCGNCVYIFSSHGIYQEFREHELRSEGTYIVNLKDQKIIANFKKDGVNKQLTYTYKWREKNLIIFIPSSFIPDPIEIRLELIH